MRALEARACPGNEPSRQGGRTRGYRVALDHHRLDARFARRKRRAQARGTRSNDQHRHFAVEIRILSRPDRAHSATPVSGVCHARCWPPSTTSVAPVTLRAFARKTTASAISSALGPWPSGTAAAWRAKSCCCCLALAIVGPGATALTRTFGASACASMRVAECSALFASVYETKC